jgi:hypothetical protein
LSDVLCDNQVTGIFYLSFSSLFFIILHRHFNQFAFAQIKLDLKEHDFYVGHYKIIKSNTYHILLPHIYFHYFMQTLTVFSLGYNRIGDQGTQYLAAALKTNAVKKNVLFICLRFISIFLNRRLRHSTFPTIKSEMKEHNIWAMR